MKIIEPTEIFSYEIKNFFRSVGYCRGLYAYETIKIESGNIRTRLKFIREIDGGYNPIKITFDDIAKNHVFKMCPGYWIENVDGQKMVFRPSKLFYL